MTVYVAVQDKKPKHIRALERVLFFIFPNKKIKGRTESTLSPCSGNLFHINTTNIGRRNETTKFKMLKFPLTKL